MIGPVDYEVIGFKGHNFDGSILSELNKAVEQGIIRVLDLVFVIKNTDGTIDEGEYEEQTGELKSTFGNFRLENDTPLLTKADITRIGERMENDSAVAAFLVEHVWARGLKQAIVDAGGYLLDDGRIHPEKVEEALKELQALPA